MGTTGMDRYQYLGKNIIIFSISSFGTKLLSFLLVPLYTSILSTAEYGVADILTTTAILVGYVFTLNIADSVLRYGLEKRERSLDILAYGVRIINLGGLIVAAGLIIIGELRLLDWPWYCYLFIWAYYFFSAMYQVVANYLRTIDQIMHVAVAGIICTASMILSNIVFLLIVRIGLIGYLISLVIGPLLATVYCVFAARIPARIWFVVSCEKRLRREMRAYSEPLIFNNIALWMNSFLDKYFIVALLGAGANGIYAVSYKIPTILSTCYAVFNQAWNISAIKEIHAADSARFYTDTYRMYNAFICAVCSVLILLNIPISRLLYAKEFFAAWQYSSVLLIAILFNALTAFLGSLFGAVKKSKIVAITTMIAAAINIAGNSILIPAYGIQGAAIATVASYGGMWLIRLFVLKRYVVLNINLFRDILAYGILGVQVICEHTATHGFVFQCVCIAAICLIYFRELIRLSLVLPRALKGLVRRK